MRAKKQHVMPAASGKWALRTEGSSRATRVFTKKEDAVTYGRRVARKGLTELYVHNKDGSVSDRSRYAKDSTPTEDKKR